MTSMTPMTRTATFRARGGRGAQLAERLLRAASLMADVPGCELWLVQRDLHDPDMIRVTEMWASRQHCDAALNLPGVEKNAAQLMDLLDGPPEVADGEPLGGARMLRAVSGSGRIKVDDELFELRPRDAVRVAPASARELEAGPDGLEVLAFGSHSPGDGEMVADWWTT
jgi:quinol monooxygenase YgiN